jgi:hypothetical protein
MAKIFLNDNINELFENVTESSVQLPKWISIVDKAAETEFSATSSAMMSAMQGGMYSETSYASSIKQNGGGYSATSSANMSQIQKGGAMSVTSSEQDVSKLISMLTSESSTANFNGISETSTASLENQLRNILSQEGGKKHRKQSGGNGAMSAEEVKRFFMGLKEQGVNVDVKLNNKSMSEFFNMASNTTTELGTVNVNNLSSTSEMFGGAKKKSSKKGKKGSKKGKKGSKKQEQEEEQESEQGGGDNPGFRAFLDLKKHIATKLGVSNSPKVGKVAGAVQKDMKEKHPGKNAVEIAKLGMEHFDKNMDHYKQMLPK